jgi:hypothetical protein
MGLFQTTSVVPLARHRRSFLFDHIRCDKLSTGLSLLVLKLDFSATQSLENYLEAAYAD